MKYGFRPLYPPMSDGCDCRDHCDRCGTADRESWRMPLFRCDSCRMPCDSCSQTVRLENPCCPGECAEVTLSVDSCGNLVICVHRDRWRNECRRPYRKC